MSYSRKYPTSDGTALAPLDWNTMVDRINGFTPAGTFRSPYSYLIDFDGTDYYASNAFQVVYGGPDDAGDVDGADSNAVVTAALASIGAEGTLTLKGPLTFNDTITLDIDAHPGLNIYFDKVTQTSTDKTVFAITGSYVEWLGKLVGNEIRTPGGYTVPAIDVSGVFNGKIEVLKNWCQTDSTYGGAGSVGLRLHSPDNSQVVYYLDAKVTLTGGYETGILLLSETNGYVNHNWLRHSVVQRFKTGIKLDCNGLNVGRNLLLDCRVDGSGNSGNSPYIGFFLEDDGNILQDCQTLDFDADEVDIYNNVAVDRRLYVFGGALSQGNITNVNIRTLVVRDLHYYKTWNWGINTITGSTSVQFLHGLKTTPNIVNVGWRNSDYDSWAWVADPTHITITVTNSGTYEFTWDATFIP